MTFQEALEKLSCKYGKFGISREFLTEQLRTGIMEHGLSLLAVYNGLRMCLALETGERELFSIEDVQEATGESREWVLEQIEEHKKELLAAGQNPEDYFPTEEPEPYSEDLPHSVWYFPQGLTS